MQQKVVAAVLLAFGWAAVLGPAAARAEGGHPMREEAAMPYQPGPEHGSERAAQIESVRARHERRLMAIDGVLGVAVGRNKLGHDAIVVYLRDASVKSRIPSEVEGYPVETETTGPIDALGGMGRR
jgi:hypothetical protein